MVQWVCLQLWPDEEVPEFQPALMDLYRSCRQLAARILELMAVGLQLQVGYGCVLNHTTTFHSLDKKVLNRCRPIHGNNNFFEEI